MRLKLALTTLTLAMLACAAVSTPLTAPQPAPPAQTTSAPETSLPTPTLAPYPDDTPSPPTLPAPVVASPHITSLHMLNELDGWGISEAAILRTTDGGQTWYNVSPTGVTTFGYGTGNSFINATQAWILVADANDPVGSGVLYRTSDGGLTWTSIPLPFGSGDLTFLDENNGWLMLSLGAGAGSMGIAIYRTSDGGATWTQTYTNDPNVANAGDSLPLGGIKNNLTPLDANIAWVGGVTYAPETFYFYKTTDGGQNWAVQNLPPAPGMQNTEIAIDSGPIFTSPSDGILPVRFTGDTLRTGFYATHDGGTNWEFLSFMPGAGAVNFASVSDGFFWSGEQLFISVDGGHTWTNVNTNILFGETFAGMDFVNAHTGWVWTHDQNEQYGLYKSADGGKTWVSQEN